MTDTGTNTPIHQVVVIGGGTSRHTAAIYAAGVGLNPLVFEGSVTAGSALYTTTDVENFPGFAQGNHGPELIDAMRKQAERFGATYITDDDAMDLTRDIKTSDRRRRAAAPDSHRHPRHRPRATPSPNEAVPAASHAGQRQGRAHVRYRHPQYLHKYLILGITHGAVRNHSK